MLIEKIYEQMINIDCDCISKLFTNNFDDVLMDMLKNKYEGVCLNGGLIISIDRIIRRSEIEIMKNGTDGTGIISITFSTTSMICEMNSIIVDVKILKINEQQILIAENKDTIIRICSNPKFMGLSKDDMIIAKVKKSLYTPGSPKITAIADIYVPKTEEMTYFTYEEPITDEEKSILNNLIDDIQSIRDIIRQTNTSIINYFAQLFYPYKTKKNIPKGTIKNIIDITKEFIEGSDSDIAFKTSPVINLFKGDVITGLETNEGVIYRNKFEVLVDLLTQLKTNVQMLYDLIVQYPTQEDINRNKTLNKM